MCPPAAWAAVVSAAAVGVVTVLLAESVEQLATVITLDRASRETEMRFIN